MSEIKTDKYKFPIHVECGSWIETGLPCTNCSNTEEKKKKCTTCIRKGNLNWLTDIDKLNEQE